MKWSKLLEPEQNKPYYQELQQFVDSEYKTKTIYPPRHQIMNALNLKDDKELLAKYQNEEYINYKKEYVMKSVPNFNKIIQNLDFSVLKSKDVRKHLKARGEDSAFTLCDSYNYKSFDATNPRLWKLLGIHDAATDDTKWLYNWLKSTYPKCLDVDTGGWTG